jgi:hypothetical protein
MSFDSDVALVGTGAAPLVAATHLLAEGKTVLILNPDWDFFLEDSELPFDPMESIPSVDSERLRRNSSEEALQSLRPGFPGAVEYWAGPEIPATSGYRDLSAPFVRARSRLWVKNEELTELEDLYVLASDTGFNPQLLEGLQVSKRFPGASAHGEGTQGVAGLWVPRIYDIDVTRYRNGLLEFVRDRSGVGQGSQVVCNARQFEIMPGGIRFHAEGKIHTARLNEGMLVFWTPRLTKWVLSQARRSEVQPVMPRGLRLWEQWSLVSREVIDASAVGVFKNLAVWAEVEGQPDPAAPVHRLEVLRAGPLVETLNGTEPTSGHLFSSDSFNSLSNFFYGFLKWERVTVRGMKPRALFEWGKSGSWSLSKSDLRAKVVMACDGPLAEVVRSARQSCLELGGP